MILYEIPKHIRIFRIQRMNHVFHIDESEARFRAYISQQQSTPGRAQNPPSDDQAQQAQHAPFQTAQSDQIHQQIRRARHVDRRCKLRSVTIYGTVSRTATHRIPTYINARGVKRSVPCILLRLLHSFHLMQLFVLLPWSGMKLGFQYY